MGHESSSGRSASRRFGARLVAVAVLALLPLSSAALALAQESHSTPEQQGPTDPELKKVLRGLMCQCGCNMSVLACEGTMTCEVGGSMRADAQRLLESGMGPGDVLDQFATDYGEQVLTAPTKSGFNLTAWVLPFAALGIAGMVVAFALRSWRVRQVALPGEDEVIRADPAYLAKVEEELRQED